MRPGNQSNKRMRGRGRKGPNPLSRSYESNGPDVKIRGTALHIAEKYQQLARDAQASGDRVMSENYLQHAEHYLRIVAAAQAHMQPAAQSSRSDAEDTGQEAAGVPGSASGSGDRRERAPAAAAAAAETVGENSPQPYIEDMPLIDPSGRVNGHASEAGSENGEETKPRRRPRGTRGRGSKPETAEATGEAAETSAGSEAAPAQTSDEAEAPKPRSRRTPRTRRAKPAEESADAEAVAAGE